MSLLKRFSNLSVLRCCCNQRYFQALPAQWVSGQGKIRNIPTCKYVVLIFLKCFSFIFITRNKHEKANVSIDVLAKCKLNVRPIFKTGQICFRILAATIVIRLRANGTSENENTQLSHTNGALLIYLQNSRKNMWHIHNAYFQIITERDSSGILYVWQSTTVDQVSYMPVHYV